MSFLYPTFLIGAIAIALPIILHLLRRDVAPEVPFTAVHLLRKSPIERSKRRRLRDLLLLAARIGALILLATAFARPYRADATAGSGAVIVALDRSYSMTAPGRFPHAQELVRTAIDNAGAARVALLAFDERVDVVSPLGTGAEARDALKGLHPGFAGTRYAPVIAKAVEIADGAPARVVIVTDLQRAGWEDEQPVVIPSTVGVDVADSGEPTENAAVVQARVQPGTVLASIRNGGHSTFSGNVRISLDNRDVASGTATVPAGATIDVPIRYQAPRSGTLNVSIDDPRGFAADNRRFVLLDPLPRRPALIVTASGAAGQSGFYLSRALAATDGEDDALDVDVVAGSALAGLSAEELSRRAAVVLLATRGIDRRAREVISNFVRSGGGLIVAAGPDAEPSVVSVLVNGASEPRAIDPGDHALALSATDLRHPVFQPFGGLVANLGHVRFNRVWRLKPEGWDVAATFTDGTPALLERAEGHGRLVFFASDLDRRWNDFPLHPAFVPFAIETVRYAMGQNQHEREYSVSQVPSGVSPVPGVYRIPPANRAIVVNVDPRESTVERITREEFGKMLQRVDAAPASPAIIRAQQLEARQGYWRYGLILMLAALVGESFVGRAR
jgi:hypothetical protein